MGLGALTEQRLEEKKGFSHPPPKSLSSISLLEMTPEAHPYRGQYTGGCAPTCMHSHTNMLLCHIPLLPKLSGEILCISIACIKCYVGFCFVLFFLTIHMTVVFDFGKVFYVCTQILRLFCESRLGPLSGQNSVKFTKHSSKQFKKKIQILLPLKSVVILPVRKKHALIKQKVNLPARMLGCSYSRSVCICVLGISRSIFSRVS